MAETRKRLAPPDRVPVWATKDLLDADGKVAVAKGTRREVFQVDARELCERGEWSRTKPGGAAPASARAQLAESAEAFALTDIPGVPRSTAAALREAGFGSVEALLAAKVEDLTGVKGVGTKYARAILGHVRDRFGELAPPAIEEADEDLEQEGEPEDDGDGEEG